MAFESIRLSHLLGILGPEIPERIADPLVNGLTVDSRRVGPGWIFVAVPGTRMDGHEFIDEAVRRGAAAVVAERFAGDRSVPVIRVPNSRAAAARLASAFYGNPEKSIEIVGVTGTNGKTTVAILLESIFRHADRQPGLIGTLYYRWKAEEIRAERTTPDAIELYALLRRMADGGVRSLIMEVSSHALDMDRVHGLRFRGAVFTNLSRDHLDYHKTLKAYANAKSRLFSYLDPSGVGVINADDSWAGLMADAASARVVTYGARKPDSDYRVKPNPAGPPGFLLIHRERTWAFPTGLPGSFNRLNAAAAAVTALEMGLDRKAVERGLAAVNRVPGRMEGWVSPSGIRVIVDYAHTPQALRQVLKAVREMTEGKVGLVFGCGGDRDRGKRPQMGRTAEALAHRIYLTSDNPRNEDPESIIADIQKGMSKTAAVRTIPDRRSAIQTALREARKGDTVLIAGKGHETVQESRGKTEPFSDAGEARRILKNEGRSA